MRIYIGYDSREDIAYQVAKKSAGDHEVIPLVQNCLRATGVYWRGYDEKASTEFSLTRFLVPHLNDFNGWALFVDCDVVFLADPSELEQYIDDKYAVMCVKHEFTPQNTVKMDGKTQHIYPRKNWSSVVLYNCGHPANKALNQGYVNKALPANLHQFAWLDDEQIGELPIEWNWLVGWYKEPDDGTPKLLHYTDGGPWFEGYENCEYADKWFQHL